MPNILMLALLPMIEKGNHATWLKNGSEKWDAANLEKLALPSVAEVVAAAKAVCYR